MTYCLGILTKEGLVMAADSRTNAGVDYISTYQKLFDFSIDHDRTILLCTSGNLSITQSALTLMQQDIKAKAEVSLHTLPSLFEIARYIGGIIRQVQDQNRPWLEKDKIDYQCTLLLGGQIRGTEPQLFMIYSQGNLFKPRKKSRFCRLVRRNMANRFSIVCFRLTLRSHRQQNVRCYRSIPQ
jgi:putative proteasome-type protease